VQYSGGDRRELEAAAGVEQAAQGPAHPIHDLPHHHREGERPERGTG